MKTVTVTPQVRLTRTRWDAGFSIAKCVRRLAKFCRATDNASQAMRAFAAAQETPMNTEVKTTPGEGRRILRELIDEWDMSTIVNWMNERYCNDRTFVKRMDPAEADRLGRSLDWFRANWRLDNSENPCP